MWAVIEDGSITRVIKHGLNVKVPKCAEVIGNLDLLTVEERKSLGVYKIVEPEPVDHRYYAATYTKNTIDHFNGQVIQTNEISPQPIERIRTYRLEELKEIRDRRLKCERIETHVMTAQICNSHVDGEIPYYIDIDVDEELVNHLSLLDGDLDPTFIESVDGEMHRFFGGELDRLISKVRDLRRDLYKAYAESMYLINNWEETDPDSLIEADLEEMFQERFMTNEFLQP